MLYNSVCFVSAKCSYHLYLESLFENKSFSVLLKYLLKTNVNAYVLNSLLSWKNVHRFINIISNSIIIYILADRLHQTQTNAKFNSVVPLFSALLCVEMNIHSTLFFTMLSNFSTSDT